MEKLNTPFGKIDILLDGQPIDHIIQEGQTGFDLWPDIKGRYQISVKYIPDGKEHSLLCTFSPTCAYERDYDHGERLECQAFYNSQKIKMSIGIECEFDYDLDNSRISYGYDYDAEYLENGMAITILPETKTQDYIFGIAWIDNVRYCFDQTREEENREYQTHLAADPSFRL